MESPTQCNCTSRLQIPNSHMLVTLHLIYFKCFKFCSLSNLMPNFITKNFHVEFMSNFKVVELEFEFEPGDLDCALTSKM
jgi:hypothetical protein